MTFDLRGKEIEWDEVKEYLKEYVGDIYQIADTKAKANAAQGIPELIKIAGGKHFRPNTSKKAQ